MARQHGIDTETVKNIIIDSGAVYKDYGESGEKVLGATRGGNAFVIEQEIKEMEVDGARVPVKGLRRITKVTARITANFIEMHKDILLAALPGSESEAYPSYAGKTHTKITRDRDIESGLAGESGDDYITNIAIVGEVSGDATPVVIILSNVIADGNLEMNFVEKDEMVTTVQFTAHQDPSDLDTEPWEIRYPKVPLES